MDVPPGYSVIWKPGCGKSFADVISDYEREIIYVSRYDGNNLEGICRGPAKANSSFTRGKFDIAYALVDPMGVEFLAFKGEVSGDDFNGQDKKWEDDIPF
jgi:hypothetical protein